MIGLWILAACGPGPEPVASAEPLPTAYHDEAAARAEALFPDPARGGPPLQLSSSPLPPFSGVDRAVARYVGSRRCMDCHGPSGEVWTTSAHAHSVTTLQEAQRAFDPACLRCHTTGLGHPGGFGSGGDRELLAEVGCESCHGPGSVHAWGGLAGYGGLPAGPEACVACHTHDTSPDFRFEPTWARIAHGTP